MLTERSRRRSEAEKGPRPWPDDRLYNKRSLFLFTLQNPFRQAIIRMIEWEHWDNKVIGVILCNTITLAMYDCFDTPQMRMCAPEELNTPAGPYGYCNKMKTGTAPPPRLRLPSRPQRAPPHLRHDACTGSQPPVLLLKLYTCNRIVESCGRSQRMVLGIVLSFQISISRNIWAATLRTLLASSFRRTSPMSL